MIAIDFDRSPAPAAAGLPTMPVVHRDADAGAEGDDDGDDAATMMVGMPMSSSIMLIIIMVPLMIGAGYADPGLLSLTVTPGPRCLS
ncbi:hypothetical protein [Bradyrhizobium ganzhouense]|uniref:hypothetical protein n=1 Tax=Bradyrhizobium ganzhouense TaxID=1179767 RepID=UPI003CEAB651